MVGWTEYGQHEYLLESATTSEAMTAAGALLLMLRPEQQELVTE